MTIMEENTSENILRRHRLTWALLALLLVVRLIAMGVVPYFDTTETRYGEISRKMVEMNDWTTLWFDYGDPYLSKPPFAFWLTAFSFKLFGVHEFVGRLPHLLVSLVIVAMVGWLAGRRDRDAVLPAVALLFGMVLYLVVAGVVMVDIEFTLALTMIMAGFWLAMEDRERPPGAIDWPAAGLLFGGTVLGLLTRGPLAVVLPAMTLVPWTAWHRRWRDAWRRLPWLSGTLVTLVLSLPWYIITELRNPGYLRYFIIGEHFQRYLIPGWTGDRFGNAHRGPIGIIWVFAALGTLPWSVIIPISLWRWHKTRSPDGGATARPDERAWRDYLLLWVLVPMAFFTFSAQVTIPYVMPALPAVALLTVWWVVRKIGTGQFVMRALNIGLAFDLLLLIVLLRAAMIPSAMAYRTDMYLVQAYEHAAARTASGSWQAPLIYVAPRVTFSGQFYSRARALSADGPEQALILVGTHSAYLATTRPDTVIAWFNDYNKAHSAPADAAQPPRSIAVVGRYGTRSLLFLAESPS